MHKSLIIILGLLTILLQLGTSNMKISNANAIADLIIKEIKKQVSVSSLNVTISMWMSMD